MHHHKTYMYINFQQNRVNRSVKTVRTNIFAKNGTYICKEWYIYLQMIESCINLQLPIVILKNSIPLDMHHHKTYMYNNFQQNRVNRSVITMHTNLFA